MKLLFDQNLSPRLVGRIADIFPDSNHVEALGMGSAPDTDIWNLAAKNSYLIVTKDVDFNDMSILLGAPPKVIWIQLGNCSTTEIEQLLRNHFNVIQDFVSDLVLRILRLW